LNQNNIDLGILRFTEISTRSRVRPEKREAVFR
jgi:hypothetical protein